MSETSKAWDELDAHDECAAVNAMSTTHILSETYKSNHPTKETLRQERFAQWETETLASKPDDAYCGPHLTFPLTQDQVDLLGVHFAYAQDPTTRLPIWRQGA